LLLERTFHRIFMNILVVDDEVNILKTTSVALKTMGHVPFTAETTSQAERRIDSEKIDAMFLDVMLGHENGIDFLKKLKERECDIPVIVFTAHSTIESAVEAMRSGAHDYISKPFIPEDIRQKLTKLEKNIRLKSKVEDLESRVAENQPGIMLDSNEPAVQKTYELAFKAAASEANILLLGPSGTGKTILARSIHERSNRTDRRFVTVNCPSLSKELLESELFGHVKGAFTGATKETWGKVSAADGGTLFLDEIGEISMDMQPKLLRLLQDREYERVGDTKTRKADVRVIAATNQNLKEAVDKGNFREDLYYRLNVISLTMPALQQRPGDILPIAENYLKFFAAQLGKPNLTFSEEAAHVIIDYPWPGNLRELRNTIERAVILGVEKTINVEDFPDTLQDQEASSVQPGHLISIEQIEEEHIRRILAKTDSLDKAASVLGIDTATLYRKRKKYELA